MQKMNQTSKMTLRNLDGVLSDYNVLVDVICNDLNGHGYKADAIRLRSHLNLVTERFVHCSDEETLKEQLASLAANVKKSCIAHRSISDPCDKFYIRPY